MLLLLLPSPQNGLQRRGSLLLFAVVLLCVVPVDASLPAGRKCPLFKDCAKLGRQFCRPGSSHCGPCFFSLEENEEGQCVVRNRNHQHGKESFYPDPDAEIDYLQSVIEKQEVTEIKPPKKESKHPVTSQADPTPSALPNTQTHQPGSTAVGGRAGPVAVPAPGNDGVTVILVSLCVTLGTVAVILATVCYVKLQKESRLAEKVDYPAFGGAGVPAATVNGTSMGDKTLAQSAQMYHYQHQKQQMVSIRNNKPEQKVIDNEITSDEEEVGGDFTVYECPGLAPTGEMEVKNPLFDDSTLHYPENHK